MRRGTSRYLWLCVEADEYELPLVVADSARELAEKVGTSKTNVENLALYDYNGKATGRRFVKVPKEEKNEESR